MARQFDTIPIGDGRSSSTDLIQCALNRFGSATALVAHWIKSSSLSRMTETRPHVLTLTRRFPTTAARLFALWTDPAALLQWSELRSCNLDVRLDGWYRFEFPAPPGEEDVTTGSFLEVDSPRRLAFTWDGSSPCGPTGETLVWLDFEEFAEESELRLRHEFIHEQSMIECKSGWEYWFDSLDKHLRLSEAR